MAKLIHVESGEVLLNQLAIADTFWKRFKGLQFRRSLAKDAGLLLAPCDSVHTCFCFFTLDVVFLSSDGVVIDVRNAVRPWRLVPPVKHARYVLEMTAGQTGLAAGDRLAMSWTTPSEPSKRLRDFPIWEK